MQKNCLTCRNNFHIPPRDLEFYNRLSPRIDGKAYSIPVPDYCPDCRRRQRLCFRNERQLYRRNCDLTGKPIVSVYSPDKPYKVYDHRAWWSDSSDREDICLEIDFSRPFFDQFEELVMRMPIPSLTLVNCENSAYNHKLFKSKSCFLSFFSQECFDCLYVTQAAHLKNCMEVWFGNSMDLCYWIFRGEKLFHCFYCERCMGSSELLFCKLCTDCHHCFGCYGLKHKQYCIFNRQYTKEQYLDFLRKIDLGSHNQVKQAIRRSQRFFSTLPINPTAGEFKQNCFGDIVYYSRNVGRSFSIAYCEDVSYLYECTHSNHVQDVDCSTGATGLCYQVVDSQVIFQLGFSYNCFNCASSFYLFDCYETQLSFGCVGLYNRSYCILNRQYTKDEFHRLLAKLIDHMKETGEWGQFFPAHLSRFGANETDAFPFETSQDTIESAGYKWSPFRRDHSHIKTFIKAEELPDNIKDVDDSILNKAIACEKSGRFFRIESEELKFYRREKLPLPRLHPDERLRSLKSARNPLQFRPGTCCCEEDEHKHVGVCGKDFLTTYPSESKQRLYCTECFERWIYY